jgi:hypothetical protein
MTGMTMDPMTANIVTLVTLVAAGILGVTLSVRDRSAIRNRPGAQADEAGR